MSFTERSPIEQGFSAVYTNQVQPKLQEFEFERKAVLKKTYLIMALTVVAAIAAVGVAYAIWAEDSIPAAPILAAMGGLFGLFVEWSTAKGKWGATIKDTAMPAICDHVGDLTYESGGSAFSVTPFMDMRLLPKHDRANLRSLLRGTHNGTAFKMVHARLTVTYEDHNDRRRTETLFQGLLFRIERAEPAPGRIALMRDRGGIGNKLAEKFAFGSTRALPKVTFDHEAFEAAFEVYADDPVAAKAYMSDAMLDALLQIGQEQGQGLGAKAYVAGFERQSFYMALQRSGSFMKMGDLTTPVEEIEDDLHRVFDDIALVYHVIDRLNLAFAAPDGAS